MRIACVDQSARERLSLCSLLDEVYSACRHTIGHQSRVSWYPASREEALINSAPDCFCLGPGFSSESAYQTCKELRQAFPHVPLVLFVPSERYSLRLLKRFERITSEVCSLEETPIRVVHTLESLAAKASKQKQGQLLYVQGLKGGVGSTSLVSGFAHAAEALGLSSVVIDLSRHSALCHFLGTERWQAAEVSSLLFEGIDPDTTLVDKALVQAPNGINLFLPPAGGSEVRERWLRNPDTLGTSLEVIEILQERFDLVIVDSERTEGILPFALFCRADIRLYVTSNDPASVSLLGSLLSSAVDAPGEGKLRLILNSLLDDGLSRDDVLNTVMQLDGFAGQEEMILAGVIPHDTRAAQWIGTANSFYTEAGAATQRMLEASLLSLLTNEPLRRTSLTNPRRFLGDLKRFWQDRKGSKPQLNPVPLLPQPNGTDLQTTNGRVVVAEVGERIIGPIFRPSEQALPNFSLKTEVFFSRDTALNTQDQNIQLSTSPSYENARFLQKEFGNSEACSKEPWSLYEPPQIVNQD